MPGWISTLLALVLALLRVAPPTLAAVNARRERTALDRQQQKDARVDAAIDGPSNP